MARTTAHSASGVTSNEVLKTSCATHASRVNVSQETPGANASVHDHNDGEDQSRHHSHLRTLQFQVAEGSQQPLRLNQNAERQRKHRAHRQQIENSMEAICSTDSKSEVHTRVSFKQREDRSSVQNASPVLFNNARSASNARPLFYLLQNARIAFYLSQNAMLAFLILNVRPAFCLCLSQNATLAFLILNARPAFCLSQNTTPAFLVLNTRLVF